MEPQVVEQVAAQQSATWWIILGSCVAVFAAMKILLRSEWVKAHWLTTNWRKQAMVVFLSAAAAVAVYAVTQVPESTVPVWLLTALSAMGVKGGVKGVTEDIAARKAALEEDLALKVQAAVAAKTDPPAADPVVTEVKP